MSVMGSVPEGHASQEYSLVLVLCTTISDGSGQFNDLGLKSQLVTGISAPDLKAAKTALSSDEKFEFSCGYRLGYITLSTDGE